MSFRLDIRGTIVLTVVMLLVSYALGYFMSGYVYCIILAVIWVAVMAAANWRWLRYQLGKKGGEDGEYQG